MPGGEIPSAFGPHFPYLHCSGYITGPHSEPSEMQWVGLWALGSSRWRPVPSSGASIWDLNHTPQLYLLQQPPQMLSRVDRSQGWGAGSGPLPRRTQRQESHCQACAHGWRNDEPEGWWERQLHVERPAPWAHGHAHPLFHRLGQMVGAAEGRVPCSPLPQPRGFEGA